MVDTVKLRITDYEVKSSSNLTIAPSSYKLADGILQQENYLFDTAEGQSVYGGKAYLNTPDFQLTIAPMRNSQVSCFVQFSAPKLLTGQNFNSVGSGGLFASLNRLETQLHKQGIDCSVASADLSRLDIFKNAILDEPFAAYRPIFQLLKFPRKKLRDYGETFLHTAGQSQLCIYDKLAEMRETKQAMIPNIDSAARFELRLLNKKEINTKLGIVKASELVSNYKDVKEYYRHHLGQTIFKYEPSEIEFFSKDEIVQQLQRVEQITGRNYMNNYLELIGLETILQNTTIDTLKAAVMEVSGSRLKAYRIVKKLEKAEKDLLLMKSSPQSRKTYKELYLELLQKIAA